MLRPAGHSFNNRIRTNRAFLAVVDDFFGFVVHERDLHVHGDERRCFASRPKNLVGRPLSQGISGRNQGSDVSHEIE